MWLLDILNINNFKEQITNQQIQIVHLKEANANLVNQLNELGANDYFTVKNNTERLKEEYNQKLQEFNTLSEGITEQIEKNQKLEKQMWSAKNKLGRMKELYKCIENVLNNFIDMPVGYDNCRLSQREFEESELLAPSVMLKLHCMDMKDLKKAYRENEKQITELLAKYSSRYTTKANKTIYDLLVISLRAEIQNILYNLKYEKLDISIEKVKEITQKYIKIACEGNQSIAGTLTKFIGEIEYLFINSVKIEYNYYVKKEQARQEQLAIKEQMRQEAEERKALAAEKAKIEKEEEKFNSEITKLTEQMNASSDEEKEQLNRRILELQAQLSSVIVKKEEISKLQNGKAGNVYIISNLGSFGDNMFKIGMTRRQDPQDRVNELGDASVPFKFDVHSFIFSDDAVSLENKLHQMLNDKRVNKVNLRKEFFYTTIDELENLVNEIAPTAEFNRTMLAEEFRQSQSSDEMYTNDFATEDDEDE